MDDRVLYRHIESSADHDKLQQDLLQLEEWVAIWKVISLLVNVISCPSPLSVSHSHYRTRIVTLPYRDVPEIVRSVHHQLPQLNKAGCGGEKESK